MFTLFFQNAEPGGSAAAGSGALHNEYEPVPEYPLAADDALAATADEGGDAQDPVLVRKEIEAGEGSDVPPDQSVDP